MIRDAETTEPGFFYFDGAATPASATEARGCSPTSRATFCDTHNLPAGASSTTR
jgi:hypothetical protein